MINPADTITIIQARLESTRLANKILYPFGYESILGTIIKTCLSMGPEVMVLGDRASTAVVKPLADHYGVWYESGDSGSLLEDFINVSTTYGYINRVCADSPLTSGPLTRYLFMVGNPLTDWTIMSGVPPGMVGGIARREALQRLQGQSPTTSEKRHVTSGLIGRDSFTVQWVPAPNLTVDTITDYNRVREMLG